MMQEILENSSLIKNGKLMTENTQEIDNQSQKEALTQVDDNNTNQSDDGDKKAHRFKKGQMLTFVRVRFPGNAKSFPFLLGKRKFVYAQKVMAMSDRGMSIGYINSFPYEQEFDESMLPIKSISKVATDEDIEEQQSYHRNEVEAEKLCIRLIEKHELDMNLTHVEFIQFGKKAVFYFTAPARVDFRNLVKDLVSDLKMRIELRQISVRDRAAAIGAIGACGLQTCCSSFLTNYGNASIKMAKNQNLALIPSKINGICGQIKCCMRYEDNVYSEKRKLLPREYDFIKTKNGDRGKVIKLHLIAEEFVMLTDKGYMRRYHRNQYNPDKYKLPEDWKFPTEFRSIISETSEVIGKEIVIKKEDDFVSSFEDYQAVALELDDEDNDAIIEDVEIKKRFLDESEDGYGDETKPGHKKNPRGNKRNNRSRNSNRSPRSFQSKNRNSENNKGDQPNKKPRQFNRSKTQNDNNDEGQTRDSNRPQRRRNNRKPRNFKRSADKGSQKTDQPNNTNSKKDTKKTSQKPE